LALEYFHVTPLGTVHILLPFDVMEIYVGMKMSMEVVSMNVGVISGFRQGVNEI